MRHRPRDALLRVQLLGRVVIGVYQQEDAVQPNAEHEEEDELRRKGDGDLHQHQHQH